MDGGPGIGIPPHPTRTLPMPGMTGGPGTGVQERVVRVDPGRPVGPTIYPDDCGGFGPNWNAAKCWGVEGGGMFQGGTRVQQKKIAKRCKDREVCGPVVGRFAMVPVQQECCGGDQTSKDVWREEVCAHRDAQWQKQLDIVEKYISSLRSKLAVITTSRIDVGVVVNCDNDGLRLLIQNIEQDILAVLVAKAQYDASINYQTLMWQEQVQNVEQFEWELEQRYQETVRLTTEVTTLQNSKSHSMRYTSFNQRYQAELVQGQSKMTEQSVIIARMMADKAGREAQIHDLQHRVCVLELHVAKQLKARDELVVDLQCCKTKKCVKLMPLKEDDGRVIQVQKMRELSDHYTITVTEMERCLFTEESNLKKARADQESLKFRIKMWEQETKKQVQMLEELIEIDKQNFQKAIEELDVEFSELKKKNSNPDDVLRVQLNAQIREFDVLSAKFQALVKKDADAQKQLATFKIELEY